MSIHDLPQELLHCIADYVPLEDIFTFALTCRGVNLACLPRLSEAAASANRYQTTCITEPSDIIRLLLEIALSPCVWSFVKELEVGDPAGGVGWDAGYDMSQNKVRTCLQQIHPIIDNYTSLSLEGSYTWSDLLAILLWIVPNVQVFHLVLPTSDNGNGSIHNLMLRTFPQLGKSGHTSLFSTVKKLMISTLDGLDFARSYNAYIDIDIFRQLGELGML